MFRTQVQVESAKLMARRDPADGSPAEMPVFIARPQGPTRVRRPALLLIQEIFGINPHIQDVVQRFAAQGYVVVAPDLFYRSGHWHSFTYEADQREAIKPMLGLLTEELVMGDVTAALDFLAAQPDVDPDRIGVVGYCYGGRISLLTAMRLPERVKAAALYYGGGLVTDQPDAPVNRVGSIRCPVIGFYGALDKHIPQAQVERLEQALTAAGVNNEIYCYPDADHGFACDARASYGARAAQDAWQRTLRLFEAQLGPVPAVDWDSHQ